MENNNLSDIYLPKISRPKLSKTSCNRNEPKHLVHKTYIKLNKYHPKIKANSKKKEIIKTLDIIHKLDLDNKVDEVYKEEMLMEQKREKINNNKEIREKRLGIFKKKDSNLEEEEEKTQENKLKKINEKIVEKYGMREKEIKMEKKYNYNLKELEKTEKEIKEMTKEIKEKVSKIDNNKMEINVLDQYGENIDKKEIFSEEPIKILEQKKSTKVLHIFEKKDFKKRRSSMVKLTDVRKDCQIIVKKHQRDKKHKNIEKTVIIDRAKLDNLIKEYEQLKQKEINIKNEILNSQKELVNIYHITLYEGLDFRNYGLCTYILNIWNMGMNVDINFFPTYLDKISIDYLFDKARKILYTAKLKKLIEEADLDYINTFKKCKDEENLLCKSNNNADEFYKTKITETDSFYKKYPNTKLFMINYNKKIESESDKLGNNKVNIIHFRNLNIPSAIIEKNKRKENLKCLIQLHKKQMEKDERNEVNRIAKEFLYNDYEKTHQVCIETIIGALCGEENKDQQLNYFYKLKKEYNDNLKKIEFFNKFKKKVSI